MPIFTIEPRKRYNTNLAEYQTSLGRSALESGALAFRESPMTASMNALRLAELNAPPTPLDREITPEEIIAGVEEPVVPEKKLIPAEEARERVKSLNLRLDIPDEGMYEPALDFLIDLKKQENLSRNIIERGPTGFWAGAARFTAALGGSMLDPVNVGAAFVPVVGQARYASMMSKATTTLQRAGVRARVGAVEGLAGAALVEPLSYFPLQYTQADYTMTDSLLNIGLGTVLGSGLHVAGGGSADFYRNWRNRPDPFVRFKDLSVDEIKQVQEVDTVLQRGIQTPEELGIILRNYSPRVLRAAGLIKDPAPDISAEEVAAPAGSIFGEDTQLTIGQTKVPAQWAVVDLVDVEATMSKADNQWRDRTRQASAAQIREIANAPDYDQLQWSPIMDFGAPTISVDGLVIGGNGRIMGISDAYDRGTAANYRSRMLAELENYGIDPTAIQNMRKPMMVRILKNRVDVKKAAIISNEGGSARMSALEQAAVDSERLGDFRRFDVPETGDMNIASNREAIRQWVSQFPTNQRPALLTAEGYLSKEGVMRLRNAILYRAYGDSPVLKRLVESTDPESANVSTALVRAAGPIADARDRIKAGDLYDLDLSDDIQAAASKLSELRKKGQRYEDWIAQQDMLGIGMTDVQLRLLEFLDNNIRSARAMSSLLTKYYEALDAAGDPKQADIFGDVAPPTKDDLLQQALDDFENDPSAAARVSKVSPETRELALRTAVGQFADGRDINIDPILNADPSIDTTTPESLRAAAEAEQSPESIATADFDASAKADATKPMDDVDVALDDAVQRAQEAVERGNEAYKYSREQGNRLLAVHNLSAENLAFASDIGGLSVPSIGVITADRGGIEGFGEITLIGKSVLADPAREPVFSSDAYTTRFPRPEWPKAKVKDAEELFRAVRPFDDEFGGGVASQTFDYMVNNPDANRIIDLWLRAESTRAMFLRDQGIDIQPILKEPRPESGLTVEQLQELDPLLTQVIELSNEVKDWIDLPETQDLISKTISFLSENYAAVKSARFIESMVQKISENPLFYLRRDRDIVARGPQTDIFETRKIIDSEIDSRAAEFKKWVESMVLPRFGEPFLRIGRQKTPYTLDNIVKFMTRKPVRGAEQTMTYGTGQVRAAAAVKFKDIEQMRAAAKESIVDPDEYRAAKQETEQTLENYREMMLEQKFKYKDTWEQLDASMRALAKWSTNKNKTAESMRAAMRSEGFTDAANIPDADIEFAIQAANDLLNAPVPYFEAKPSRAVGLQEFAGAVVPEKASKQVLDILSANNIPTRVYKDEDSRQEVVQSFAKELDEKNKNVLFARGEGQPEYVQTVEEVTNIIRQSFGRATDDLLKAGQIEIVETPADLPPRPDGTPHFDDVRGMYFRGKTYIVARNARPERLKGTVLHEIGEHAGMEKMLGKELYDELQESFYQGMLRGDKAFLDAAARVPQDTDLRDVASEQLAYLVQNAPELPIVKRVIAAVRAWLWRTFKFARDRIELSEADIRALAVSSLHAAARRARNARRMEIEDGIVSPRMARSSFENSVLNSAPRKPKTPTALGMEYERLYSNYYKRAYGKYRKDGMDDLDAQTSARKDLDAYKERVRTGQYDPLKRTKFGKERPVSEAGDRVMYSRDADYPTDLALELKVADEAVMRAEEYARAVRSVAERLENEGQAREIIRSQGVFSEQEIDDILKELRQKNTQVRARLRKVRAVATAEDRAAGMQSEAMQAANELADEMVRAAKVEKRNAALNLMVEKKGLSFIFSEFKGMEAEGFKALLAGSQMRRAGARDSVQAQQDSALGDFLGGIIADMESQNLWKLFISETMARETADALFRLDMPEAKMDGLPKEAIKMAEIIHKYQESARSLENRHGAWVGKVAGYVMRQSHDPFRIRKVSYAEWRDFVLPLLDMEKTFAVRGVTNIEASLSKMYDNFASGLHRQFDPDEALQIAFRGQGRSIARKVSESRVLYFKDGKAAFDYNERFGTAKFTDAVLGGLESSARAIGLMYKLGPNPQMMLMRLMDTVEESLRSDPISKAKFHEQRQSLLDLLAILDGSINIPGNQLAARIGANIRVWQSVSKLGGAVVSSFADIPVYAAEAKFQGRGFLNGMADAIGGLLQGRGSAEQKAIMNDLGVFFESMRNGVIRRFDTENNLGGAMSSLQTKFFKWNGLSWWTEVLQKSAALSMSADLAAMRNLSFDKIRPEMQNILSLYNIDAGKWDLIRQGVIREVDGRAYMTPEGFINIPRPALENYLNSIGRQVNDASVENLVSDLQASFRAMFVDRAEHAVIETDARTRQFLLRGTKPGTLWGEIARFFAQFKSFPVALWQRALGREVYGKGYNSVADFLKGGKGDRMGLVNLILWMTLFGYGAMSAKDILRGKSPRDPTAPSTWLAAMLQGGAFGIYGDFLFGEMKNRFGGGFLATAAGPTLGTIEDLFDIFGRLKSGEDAAAATFRTAVANTPFANLFYTRIALDYLLLYRIQEWMNPGYLRRMERRIERENAQQFLIRPSEAVR